MELQERFQTVRLTQENIEYFRSFFPEEFLPHIESGEYSGIGMVYHKIACGVLLASDEGDALFLQWLYIAPDYRRRGFAGLLMMGVRAQAVTRRIPIRTGITISAAKEEMLAFLRQYGFQLEAEGCSNVFTLGQLRASAFVRKQSRKAYTLKEKPQIQSFLNMLEKEGKLLIDLSEQNELWDALSTFTVQDAKINSCLLLRSAGENLLEVAFLYLHAKTSTEAAMNFMAMLGRSLESAQELGLPDTMELRADCITPQTEALLQKMLLDKKETVLYRGIWLPQAN